MNWRDILFSDVISLLRREKPPTVTRLLRTGTPSPKVLPWRSDLLFVTGQLAAIVRTNSPITDGLEAVARDAPTYRLKRLLRALRDDIAAGSSIADSMRKHPRFFPRFYTDLINAGEETGNLSQSLADITDGLERAASFRSIVKSYLAYLLAVLCFQCLIGMIILVKVIPTFFEIVKDFSCETPRSLHLVVTIAQFLHNRFYEILVGILLVAVSQRLLRYLVRRRRMSSTLISTVLLGVPFLRGIVIKSNLAHIALVLEKLLAGGVPLDVALEDAASLEINPIYARLMRRIKERVRNGTTMKDAMEYERFLPASFRALVSLGESSGLLPDAFRRIADSYQRDVIKTSRILLDVVAPIGVIGLGCITLSINGSIFVTLVNIMEAVLAGI